VIINLLKESSMGLLDFFKTKDNKIDVFAYCDKLFDEGKYQEVVRLMDIAIETNPSNWYSYWRKGKCYQFMNNFHKAIDEYKKGLRFEDNFDLNRGIGECYLMTEQWGSGKSALLKSYNLLLVLEKSASNNSNSNKRFNTDKANILNNLAIALFNLDEIHEAIEYSEIGIVSDPNFSGNYRILGTILLEYDITRGIKLLKQAAEFIRAMFSKRK
jgi:tetratricopeptide (TPR) repeat protein